MTLQGDPIIDPRGRALHELRQAALALQPHLGTPSERADLMLIEEALARLSLARAKQPQGLREFDASRLNHLLELTGPGLARELLARLTEDLISTREKLDHGMTETNWQLLREGSHVLISLSGSVGALSLQAMAEMLNSLAHRQDSATLVAMMPPLREELEALITLVRNTNPSGLAR